MLCHIPARPEQTLSLSTIVRDALRAAAFASTPDAALDVTGRALETIAHVARAAPGGRALAPEEGMPIGSRLCLHALARRPDLPGAVERARLLFALIEAVNEGTGGQTLTLARIGHSLTEDLSHALGRLGAASSSDEKGPAMAEITHTPRPWRAEEWSCHARTTVLVDDPSVFTGKRVIAEFDTEDDARVAAALPELVDAAVAAEAVLARGRWLDDSPDPEAVALRKLRAALKKATEVRHD